MSAEPETSVGRKPAGIHQTQRVKVMKWYESSASSVSAVMRRRHHAAKCAKPQRRVSVRIYASSSMLVRVIC